MVLALGLFLINSLCAFVPCQHLYDPPKPTLVVAGSRNAYPAGLSFANALAMESNQFPVVETRSGLVRGFPMLTARSRRIFAFTSIPYAEPPVRDLRYKNPIPRRPWKGVWDATQSAPLCLQVSALQHLRIIGVEDCLYLNVYTPEVPSNKYAKSKRFPVMVFIHGGAFAFSSGSVFGPAYLLDRDVVLVTINYRLGSMGFLSTGDEAASGNWGLKDQNLALKWVSKNIEVFGGDENTVTIFGQSAGAVSVHLHMLSNMSQGLFHRAVAQSGSAFCFWAVRNASVDYTYKLAARVRCPVSDSQTAVDCLRSKDANLISYHEAMLSDFSVFPGVFFGPVVELPGPEAFLDDWPENLYKDDRVSKVPLISGMLSGEGNGLAFVTYLVPMAMEGIDDRWFELGPKVLDIKVDNVKTVSEAIHMLRRYYMGNMPINFHSRLQLANMYGDRLITAGVHRGLQEHSKVAPTFGYFFNYSGKYSVVDSYGLNPKDWGISHDDDLLYFLNSTSYQAMNVGDPEYDMSEFMINLWTNFAAKGRPVYTTDDGDDFDFWNQVKDSNKVELALLDGEYPVMIPNPYLERINIWKALNLVTNSHVNPNFRTHDICTNPKLGCTKPKSPVPTIKPRPSSAKLLSNSSIPKEHVKYKRKIYPKESFRRNPSVNVT